MRSRNTLVRLAAAGSILFLSGLPANDPSGAAAAAVPEAASPEARAEYEEGLRLYQARDFAGAEAHLERSRKLDPTSVDTLFLLARTLQTRFRMSGEAPERSELARRAMEAYEAVLAREPRREEVYQALLALARDADDATALPWLERQAADQTLPPGRRVDALQVLAARGRVCAERQLQLIANDPILVSSSQSARDCALRGLASIEIALQLAPSRGSAWSEQARLLMTLAQICDLQGQADQKSAYEKQAADARIRAERIRVSEASRTKSPRSY